MVVDIVKDTLSPLHIPGARSAKEFIRERLSRRNSSGTDASGGDGSDDGGGLALQRSRAMSEESALEAMKKVPSLRNFAVRGAAGAGVEEEEEAVFVVRKRHLLAVSIVPFLFGLAAWLLAKVNLARA